MLAAPDPAWRRRFEIEAQRLRDRIGAALALAHIGSTAVPGLVAKPIIDMLGTVPDHAVTEALTPALERSGYEALGAHGIPGRRYFRRSVDGQRRFHLHIFPADAPEARAHLACRDFLRAHPREALAYAAEKRRVLRVAGMDGYAAGKSGYVRDLVARASQWAQARHVLMSINDASGLRCVDIRAAVASFEWVECRRDPEDSHGWRLTGAGEAGFASPQAAQAAAARSCPWVPA